MSTQTATPKKTRSQAELARENAELKKQRGSLTIQVVHGDRTIAQMVAELVACRAELAHYHHVPHWQPEDKAKGDTIAELTNVNKGLERIIARVNKRNAVLIARVDAVLQQTQGQDQEQGQDSHLAKPQGFKRYKIAK
jgi:hypothetical protein